MFFFVNMFINTEDGTTEKLWISWNESCYFNPIDYVKKKLLNNPDFKIGYFIGKTLLKSNYLSKLWLKYHECTTQIFCSKIQSFDIIF